MPGETELRLHSIAEEETTVWILVTLHSPQNLRIVGKFEINSLQSLCSVLRLVLSSKQRELYSACIQDQHNRTSQMAALASPEKLEKLLSPKNSSHLPSALLPSLPFREPAYIAVSFKAWSLLLPPIFDKRCPQSHCCRLSSNVSSLFPKTNHTMNKRRRTNWPNRLLWSWNLLTILINADSFDKSGTQALHF